MSPVTEALTTALSGVAWKMIAAMVIAAVLAMIWKMIEKKILKFVDRKIYERKQKKLEEIKDPPNIRIERKEPTYEEWRAAKLAEEKKNQD